MAGSLGSLTVDLNADVAKFVQAMTKAEHVTKQFAERAERYVVGAAAGIGAAFALSSMKTFIDQTIEATAKLDDLSEISGTTVERLSSWGGVAKMAGVGLEEVTSAVTKMSKGLMAADEETKGAGAALAYLGISAKTASGGLRDPGEVIEEVARKLAEFKDGAGKSALAMDLLGKSGAQMLPFLKDLAEEGQLQVKVTAEQAAQAEHYEKTLVRLEGQKKAVFKVIAMELIPAMDGFATEMLNAVKGADGLRKAAGDLAKDGAIREWVETAAVAVARVYDAVKDTIALMTQVPHSIAVMVKDIQTAGAVLAKSGGNALGAYINRDEIKGILDERARFVEAANEDMAKRLQPSDMAKRLSAQFAMAANVRAGVDAGADLGGGGGRKDLKYTRTGKEGKSGADTELRQYIAALQRLEEQMGRLNNMTVQEKTLYETTQGSLRGLTQAHKDDLIVQAIKVDKMLQAIRTMEAYAVGVEALKVAQEAADAASTGFARSMTVQEQDQQFALDMIGKTAVEVAELTRNRKIDADAAVAAGQIDAQLFPEQVARIWARASEAKQAQADLAAATRLAQRSWQTGATSALNTYIDMVGNAAAQTEALMTNAFRSMEDALVKFVQTGKLDFKSLADSIISEIIRIQIRQSITGPLAQSMQTGGGLSGLLMGGLGKLFGGGGSGGNLGVSASDLGYIPAGFAGGGDPPVGRVSVVGENGPELFVPKAAGTIIPNGGLGGMSLTFAPRIDSRTDQATIMLMMRQQSAAMMSELGRRFNRNGAGSVAAALG